MILIVTCGTRSVSSTTVRIRMAEIRALQAEIGGKASEEILLLL